MVQIILFANNKIKCAIKLIRITVVLFCIILSFLYIVAIV